ncbi:MAG: TldD/PmbA family protein [Thermoleophilaceae bacterium]|nr:TldD/PmbA family protein [Thermoleophilaceae bacterium]
MGIDTAASTAVELALAQGAGSADAFGVEGEDLTVRVYEGEVESLSEAGARGLGVRVFIDGRTALAYGTDLTEPGIGALARGAVEAAQVSDPDEYAGLPERSGAADAPPISSPELARWDTERKIDLAKAVERAARERDGISQVEDTIYADSQTRVALANSTGFRGEYEQTAAYAYAYAFAGEGAELMTGLGVGAGRDPAALDPEAIGGEAAERALALRGATKPATRRCPVVLDTFVAASFAGLIGGTLSADAVQRGRSLFAGREGEEIASKAVALVDDGLHPDGPATAPFDGEGSPRRRTPLIENGVLASFLWDARTARKGGRETTGSASRSYSSKPSVGASNLVIEPGTDTLEDLCAAAGNGVLVTHVTGLHSGVNPVSGTLSVGATGRLIENGQLGAPVREMTIASDLVSMLKSVRAVGSQGRWVPFGGSVMAAPLLIESMSVSGS